MTARNAYPPLIPAAHQRTVLNNSTAVAVNSTVRAADAGVLFISCETNGARFRADGTDPTLTTGVLIPTGIVFEYKGYNGTTQLVFQRSTGTCVLNIAAFNHFGGVS